MEKNNRETKKTMLMLAIGFYIIYMFIGASTPGTNFYLLLGPFIGITVSIFTLCGWIMVYNSIAKLEMTYDDSLFRLAKTASCVGVVLYVIYNIFILLGYILPDSAFAEYVNGRATLLIGRSYEEGFVWLRRSVVIMSASVYILRIVLGVITIMAFHRSLLGQYKRVNTISIFNEIVCILVVILHACPNLMLISDDMRMIYFYIIFKLLQLAFSVYIYWLNKKVDIHMDYSNGSVFNRIPEEEYQEFLNKMNK